MKNTMVARAGLAGTKPMATIKTLRRSRAQTKGTDQGYRPRAQTVRFGLDPRNVDQSSKIKIARGIWQTGNTD
jgi:hypothetical protein